MQQFAWSTNTVNCISFWIKDLLHWGSTWKLITTQSKIHVPHHHSSLPSRQNIWHFSKSLTVRMSFPLSPTLLWISSPKIIDVIILKWMNQRVKAHRGLVDGLPTRSPSTWRNDVSFTIAQGFISAKNTFFKSEWRPPKDNISWKKMEKVELCSQLHLSPSKL